MKKALAGLCALKYWAKEMRRSGNSQRKEEMTCIISGVNTKPILPHVLTRIQEN